MRIRHFEDDGFRRDYPEEVPYPVQALKDDDLDSFIWPESKEVVFTSDMIDSIRAAWKGAGVDIAGGNWERFVGMLNSKS